ncbi:histone deacetylase family protein [Uruburuella testudinis]|uniref:Histone deacetylase family protein n=1 Tax=Uruburuella testudinis TaxID=1282863 RepID=A0ABY4DVK7_9NEIS|nr:histone deacetylase family protein [Uruburuella testudinis]UOO82871.1 histone deacetylase family protein [Uruburuella testudinis]
MKAWLRRLLGKKARTAWISHPIFLQHEPGNGHPEAAGRITAIETELQQQSIWPRLRGVQAEEASDKQLALVHASRYLNFLESMRPQPGKIYRLDDDTVMSHDSLTIARYGAGAVIKAVDRVMAEKSHNAFCAVRPPGHHAQSDKAGGFCLINNVAVGAMHAVAAHRLQRIAIIDFDVHHGNGTEEVFKDDPRILFLNSCENDLYPFPGDIPAGKNPNMVNLPFSPHTGSIEFREQVRRQWLPRLSRFKPELVLLSAGFDAHRDDEIGRLSLHEADYAWLTHKIMQAAGECPGRIISVLEGGYQLDSLAKSTAAHLYVLTGMGKPPCAVEYDAYLKTLKP